MNSGERIVLVVTEAITEAKASTAAKIGLAAFRELCLTKARNSHPDLVPFLSTTRGMAAIAITLSQLPHIVKADNPRMTEWTFVRTLQ